jgi:cob(I)alamin adenosyltransferase
MPPFFTGDGDDGTTGLLGKGRIPKHHPRAEAIGALDEAVAALGLARSLNSDAGTRAVLEAVQRHLYQVMAEVAAPGENAVRFRTIGPPQVSWIEEEIERRAETVPSPGEFLLGGDTPAGGSLDLARTVVRRAERRLSLLVDQGEVENRSLLAYLNRASSLCFVLILEGYQQADVAATRAKPAGGSAARGDR